MVPASPGGAVDIASTNPVAACRQMLVGIIEVMNCQAELFELVDAGSPPSGLTGLLDSRKKQPDQNPNDGDDNEQLNQRETRKGLDEGVPDGAATIPTM